MMVELFLKNWLKKSVSVEKNILCNINGSYEQVS